MRNVFNAFNISKVNIFQNTLSFSKPCVPRWGIDVEKMGRFYLPYTKKPTGLSPGGLFLFVC